MYLWKSSMQGFTVDLNVEGKRHADAFHSDYLEVKN